MRNIKWKLSFLALLFTQIVVPQKISKTDLSVMYSEYNFAELETTVYHASDKFSTVFVNVTFHDLTNSHSYGSIPGSRFHIRYELYVSYNDKIPLDTGSVIFQEPEVVGGEKNKSVEFNIAANFPGDYLLRIILTDLLDPDQKTSGMYRVLKNSKFTSQNFLLLEEDDSPSFDPWFGEKEFFRIQYHNTDSTQLYVRYYNQSFPLAKPPFALDKNSTYTFDPDSFFVLPLQGGISSLLELPDRGIYHIQANIDDRNGITLYRYNNGFPEVRSPAQALAPLRYLTTEREFERLLDYDNYKTAVDSFWLERASFNTGRAKKMIRKYYQRVEQANRLFSSFHEGWKTDRGLIFVIYGPPSEVYRKEGEEEWIYGEQGNPMSIRFFFFKLDNPFSQNDFSLQRSPVYKTSWLIAVENWRR